MQLKVVVITFFLQVSSLSVFCQKAILDTSLINKQLIYLNSGKIALETGYKLKLTTKKETRILFENFPNSLLIFDEWVRKTRIHRKRALVPLGVAISSLFLAKKSPKLALGLTGLALTSDIIILSKTIRDVNILENAIIERNKELLANK